METKETYLPGDKWLYFRIYTGFRTADKILAAMLKPLADDLVRRGIAEAWFFVRYADPDFHLRFRIKLINSSDVASILDLVNGSLRPYVQRKQVWKVELGTYQPEIERYGSSSIELAEHIFFHDSDASLRYIEMSGRMGWDHHRWLFAIASIDAWLNDFGLSPAEKKELLLGFSRNFGKEYGKGKELARQLSGKYRERKSQIREIMEDRNNLPWGDIINERSRLAEKQVNQIRALSLNAKLEVEFHDFLSAIIHMSMNRIFPANNRLYEMLIYDFLFRYYKSELAMAKS